MIIISNSWDTKIIRKKFPPIKYKIMLTKRKARDKISDGDPFISRKKILIYIS